jgi:hypothetical protein
LNTSKSICQNAELFQFRASATQNDLIFATNGESRVYAFSLDLNEIWSAVIPNVNTSGAVIGSNGLVAVSGTNIIKVFTPDIYAGFKELPGDNPVRFYPNPLSDVLTIKVKDNLKGSPFFICDHTGRQVLKGRLVDKTSTLDVNSLNPGLYLLHIGVGMELDHNYKLIKL